MRDKVVIITGASTGIGAALARELARRGAKVALAARDEAKLHQVAADCPDSLVVPTDVTDKAACYALVEKTVARYDRLDVLVNNAGRTMWATFEDLQDLNVFHELMQLNYFGAVYCTHAALPHLKKTGGLLVGVASVLGRTGAPTRTGYSASKHAMFGFFDSLRIELMGTGVDVTMIIPDFVLTEAHRRAYGADGKPLGVSPMQEDKIMPADVCARLAANAIEKRQRELAMSRRAKIGRWLKLIAPGRLDAIARKAIEQRK